jgi:hypothetical protein
MASRATLFKAAGWEESSLYVYIIDEVNAHAVATFTRNTTLAIRGLLPRAQIVACGDGAWSAALDQNMSLLRRGGALEFVDVFIPRMATLMNTSAAATAAVRALSKRVGWYTSGNFPAGPYALGLTVEYSAMRPRLMLGTAAWKLNVDGFLCEWRPCMYVWYMIISSYAKIAPGYLRSMVADCLLFSRQ